MKSSAVNIEKTVEQWSLSWQPDGRCGSFTKEAILAEAPPTSGVYGLFNVGCQVLIGESANIQEALLRHAKETDFYSRYLQPTGFTFEPCAEDLRKSKAAELIARYRPVLQSDSALSENGSLSDGSVGSAVHSGDSKADAGDQKFPAHERDKRPKLSRHAYFKRPRRVTFSAVFAASAVTVFCPDIPAVKNIQSQAYYAAGNPLAQISVTKPPASDRTEFDWGGQHFSLVNTVGALASQSPEPKPAKLDVRTSKPSGAARLGAKSDLTADRTGVPELLKTVKTRLHLGKKWSVQISSAPAKDIADALVQRLKANGYDGYAVQAVVKGHSYYRVRVGRFDTKEKAELLRLSLARLEGYRDAYLTRD